MNPPWNWRMRPALNPVDAISPTPSKIWVGVNNPTTTNSKLLTGTVLTHPTISPTTIRVRLFQELAIRRDAARRRARSSPSQSSLSCQWAATLTLGTGVHKGGVVADSNVFDLQATPTLTTHPSGARQWTFVATLPGHHLPPTWTWTACEGDRKKIWFLDMRYRIIAEAFHNHSLIAAARSFVTFVSTPTLSSPPSHPSCTSRAPSSTRICPVPTPIHFQPHCHTSPSSSEQHRASLDEHLHLHSPRRTAMAFTRPLQPDDTPKRPRCTDTKPRTTSKNSLTLLRSREDRTSTSHTHPIPSLSSCSPAPHSSVSLSEKPFHPSFKSTEDFDDIRITTTLPLSSKPPPPNSHPQFKLTEQVSATINLVPKIALSHLKITAVLTEVIEIVDDTGTRQVHLQHHHRMKVSHTPTAPSRREQLTCIAHMVASDKLFSPDASFDFMRITHRLDISVSYERRRVLGGLLFGEAARAEHDLWDIVDGNGMKIVSSIPLRLRHGEKPDQQISVPWLAVWGSTERIAAVGTAESRVARRKPGWATSDGEQSQTQQQESKIDALRSLAYANAGSRRREGSGGARVEADLRRFPSIKVDGNGALAKQSCPVCLELLDGVVTMLPCLHAGHRSCFGRSQNRASVCPVCRLDLSPYVAGLMVGCGEDGVEVES